MHRSFNLLTTTTMLAVALAVVQTNPARAHHRPNTYCSETGDICQSAAKVDGIRKFRLTLAAKYFDRYDLCVIGPGDSKTCKTFRVKKQGSFYGDTVRWDTNFPDEGSGAYDVVWKMTSGDRFGKKLGFHVSR
jgi:hypothetical protein